MTMNDLDRWASCRPIIEPNWIKHAEYRAYSEKMAKLEIPIKQATRSCMVEGRPGNFHLWEQFSTVVPPSPMVGSPSGGTVSSVYGIVEFSDGVKRIDPINIKFTDEDHIYLSEYEKWLSEKEKKNAEN